MALFIILDLTHLAVWEDSPLILKHKYYVQSGGNLVVVCNLADAIFSVAFNGVKLVGVDVAWAL